MTKSGITFHWSFENSMEKIPVNGVGSNSKVIIEFEGSGRAVQGYQTVGPCSVYYLCSYPGERIE